MGDGQPFQWDGPVPPVVHPLKVAIIEALSWSDEPLSAKELDEIFEGEWGLSPIAYHLRKLAATGTIEPAPQQPGRGGPQTFYTLGANEWTGNLPALE